MKHAWEARARELAHLHAVLAARRPALVVVTGAPGMGKTTLLETWGARASALGWEVAGGDACRRLAVTPSTDERGFRAALLAARASPTTARASPALARRSPLRRRAAARSIRCSTSSPGGRRSWSLLDDYCPNPQFAEWFEDGFLPELQRCGAPWWSAPRCGSRTASATAPTASWRSGSSRPPTCTQALASLGRCARPPLAPHELEVYAHEPASPPCSTA